ncbi:hypothetical protein M436DRAFT_82198 [Aureobasidium namibiae CBS 147.97]|uniref:Uncharacterized protein n=1 Tax=Aureobasidium namibiae CBS 147.97 TaxID=1043004 RepID=A0A074XE79_9PEZI|nr:uncharacterized protein M436DRAFT_82198 [Aureobasidium namibiae CBS 147.97]KEQ72926.1 hypothetical protein M436DRAFT_82198 [Aureobasidium namibiae CBS 147.97]
MLYISSDAKAAPASPRQDLAGKISTTTTQRNAPKATPASSRQSLVARSPPTAIPEPSSGKPVKNKIQPETGSARQALDPGHSSTKKDKLQTRARLPSQLKSSPPGSQPMKSPIDKFSAGRSLVTTPTGPPAKSKRKSGELLTPPGANAKSTSESLHKRRRSGQVPLTSVTDTGSPTTKGSAKKAAVKRATNIPTPINQTSSNASPVSGSANTSTDLAAARAGKAIEANQDQDNAKALETKRMSLIARCRELAIQEQQDLDQRGTQLEEAENLVKTHGFFQENYIQAWEDMAALRAEGGQIITCTHSVMQEIVYNFVKLKELQEYKSVLVHLTKLAAPGSIKAEIAENKECMDSVEPTLFKLRRRVNVFNSNMTKAFRDPVWGAEYRDNFDRAIQAHPYTMQHFDTGFLLGREFIPQWDASKVTNPGLSDDEVEDPEPQSVEPVEDTEAHMDEGLGAEVAAEAETIDDLEVDVAAEQDPSQKIPEEGPDHEARGNVGRNFEPKRLVERLVQGDIDLAGRTAMWSIMVVSTSRFMRNFSCASY